MGDQLRNLSAPQCTDTESRDLRLLIRCAVGDHRIGSHVKLLPGRHHLIKTRRGLKIESKAHPECLLAASAACRLLFRRHRKGLASHRGKRGGDQIVPDKE